ncbi:hypothetical protein ES703_34570 [subsurface metagenome]
MDILYAFIQEKFYFPKMFPGYEEYKKETPMLIPTRKNLASFLASFRKKRVVNGESKAVGCKFFEE